MHLPHNQGSTAYSHPKRAKPKLLPSGCSCRSQPHSCVHPVPCSQQRPIPTSFASSYSPYPPPFCSAPKAASTHLSKRIKAALVSAGLVQVHPLRGDDPGHHHEHSRDDGGNGGVHDEGVEAAGVEASELEGAVHLDIIDRAQEGRGGVWQSDARQAVHCRQCGRRLQGQGEGAAQVQARGLEGGL